MQRDLGLELAYLEEKNLSLISLSWFSSDPPTHHSSHPAGFSRDSPPCPLGWPVLYLNDGQNLFDDKLSFSGCSWRAAATAASLIASGKVWCVCVDGGALTDLVMYKLNPTYPPTYQVPPFVIVGMDHSGKNRSVLVRLFS